MKVVVRPLGDEIERLKANTGLEMFTIRDPKISNVTLGNQKVSMLLFEMQKVEEPVVRQAMINNYAAAFGVTLEYATQLLNNQPSAIPLRQISLEWIAE